MICLQVSSNNQHDEGDREDGRPLTVQERGGGGKANTVSE